MMTRSKQGDTVRSYFIDVENLYIKYRDLVMNGIEEELQGIKKAEQPKFIPNKGYIYIIKASDKNDSVYKIGRSKDLKSRLVTYQTGKTEDIKVMYVYRTDDLKEVEGCVKAWVKRFQYRKFKEVYQVDLNILKDVITKCANVGTKLEYKHPTRSAISMKGGYYAVLMLN
jgi:predicted GIY-YIG superfamily endonuclease